MKQRMRCRMRSSRRFAPSTSSRPTPRSGRGCSPSWPTRPGTDVARCHGGRSSSCESAVQPRLDGPAADEVAARHEQRRRLLDAVARAARQLSRGRRPPLLRGAQRDRNRRSPVVPGGDGEVSPVARPRPVARLARRRGETVIDLERALADLAGHLDHAPGDQLAESVRRRIASSEPAAAPQLRHGRTRSLVAVAAVLLLIVVASLAIAPARHAIAELARRGRGRSASLRCATRTRARAATPSPAHPAELPLTNARFGSSRRRARAVDFTIATPRAATVGELSKVVVDLRVPGGLVALDYPRFSLVEVQSFADPTRADHQVDLPRDRGRVRAASTATPGLWITGAHSIGYLDRTGRLERETVRRSGSGTDLGARRRDVPNRRSGFARNGSAGRHVDPLTRTGHERRNGAPSSGVPTT